jgi:hypothetical protein
MNLRGKKFLSDGENSTTRGFMTCTVNEILLANSKEELDMHDL